MIGKNQPNRRPAGIAVFVVGVVLGLTAGLLLFFDVVESGWAIVVLIVGIGLIGASQIAFWPGSNQD